MTAQPILVLTWLVLAHLVADFVLQTGSIATGKSASGGRALRATTLHAALVGLCLVPFAFAYAGPGALLVAAVAVSHGLIDRGKVLLTRRAEARAVAAAHRQHEGRAPTAGLGFAWTPVPAAYFVADQGAHAVVLGLAWLVLLRNSQVTEGVASFASSLAGTDPAGFHRAVLTGVVLVSLGIVNVRAGSLLVGTLVRPASTFGGPLPKAVATDMPPAGSHGAYAVTLGPFHGRLVPEAAPPTPRSSSPERVGEAIGILERILIAVLVRANAEAAIGLVIAAKTVARFRQLDDRDFAEYYLLGTLCSVLVAVGSALLASAVLSAGG